jgi:hypothetical protein
MSRDLLVKKASPSSQARTCSLMRTVSGTVREQPEIQRENNSLRRTSFDIPIRVPDRGVVCSLK